MVRFSLRNITQHCDDNELRKAKLESGKLVRNCLVDWARNKNDKIGMT